jgi:hypothetical protein
LLPLLINTTCADYELFVSRLGTKRQYRDTLLMCDRARQQTHVSGNSGQH